MYCTAQFVPTTAYPDTCCTGLLWNSFLTPSSLSLLDYVHVIVCDSFSTHSNVVLFILQRMITMEDGLEEKSTALKRLELAHQNTLIELQAKASQQDTLLQQSIEVSQCLCLLRGGAPLSFSFLLWFGLNGRGKFRDSKFMYMYHSSLSCSRPHQRSLVIVKAMVYM